MGYKTVTVTDHGTVGSWVKLASFCKDEKLKPIFGIEAYFAPDRKDRSKRVNYHQILLAKNNIGLKNIFQLVDLSFKEGFYYVPRVDWELLEKYGEGIICTTACVGGIVPSAFYPENKHAAKGYEEAKRLSLRFKHIFGKDFYHEVQYHGFDLTGEGAEGRPFCIPEETVYLEVAKLAKELDIPVVATNDVHYLKKEDAPIQEVLMAVCHGKCLKDPNRVRHDSNQFYLKSPEEMLDIFGKGSASVAGALEIADKCDAALEFGKTQLPALAIPKEYKTDMEYLEALARKGLREKGKDNLPEYEERLKEELGVVSRLKEKGRHFDAYFLIVWDYVNYARNADIMVGAGRGSGGGSLLLWCLGITELDPLKHDLLFERFLTEDRNEMPDIDVDFDSESADKIRSYICEKYGEDHFGRIGTLSVYHAKGAIRDAFKAFDPGGMWEINEGNKQAKQSKHVGSIRQEKPARDKSREISDEVSEQIPESPQPCTFFKEVADKNPDITYLYSIPQLVNFKEKYPEEFLFAEKMEGLLDKRSKHASGVLITRDPLVCLSPLERAGAGKELVTSFDMLDIEKLGGVKFDILFVKVLSILKRAIKNVSLRYGKPLNIEKIPLDDRQALDIFARGDTVAIFQFESDGMRKLLRQMKVTVFDDIVAANALFRPGPMKYIDEYIARKNGKAVAYPVPLLESVLKPTLGIMIYQEQVMRATRVLAGFSGSEADVVRKAMGKKKKAVLDAMKEKFLAGCARLKTCDQTKADKIFSDMIEFSQYAFNRSHSAGYSKTAYQCAWLKAHYPAEYMAAQLTVEANDASYDTVKRYENAVSYMRIPMLPLCINNSKEEYIVSDVKDGKVAIRRGLKGIKGVGHAGYDIVAGQPYKDMFDYCLRSGSGTKKDAVEAIIDANGFDVFKSALTERLGRTATNRDLLVEYQDAVKRAGVEKKATAAAGVKSVWDE